MVSQSATALINDSYSWSAWGGSDTQTTLKATGPVQRSDSHSNTDDMLTEKEESKKTLLYSSYGAKSTNAFMKYASLYESQTAQPLSRNNNPAVFMKLMRMKSSSEEHMLDVDSPSPSDGRSTVTFGPGVQDVTDAYTPEMTRKRGGYLQRVRELLRPRSSSLNNLNNEESSSNKEIKLRRSNLKKAKSQTLISLKEVSIDITGTPVKEQIKEGNKGVRDEPCPRCNTEEPVPADPVKSSQEYDSKNNSVDVISTNISSKHETGILSSTVVTSDTSSVTEDSTCKVSQSASPLINDGHSWSACGGSDIQKTLQATESAQRSDIHRNTDDMLTEKEESKTALLYSSYGPESTNANMNYASLFESQTPQSLSRNNNPAVFIKLMRMKSSSEEHMLDVDSPSPSNDRSTVTFGPGVRDVTDAYTLEMTRKRGGYLQRVRELFRPRSSSLNNLNNEESSSNKDIKSRRSNLKKAKSQTLISLNEVNIDITGTPVKEQMKVGNKDIREKPCPRCNAEEPVPADPVKNGHRNDNKHDPIVDISNISSKHDADILSSTEVTSDSSIVTEDSTCALATSSQTAPPLINDGYSWSAWGGSDTQTILQATEPAQRSDSHRNTDAMLTEKEESKKDLLYCSYGPESTDAIMKYASLFESPTPQSVFRNNNPAVFIKLMRMKSSSEEHMLDVDSPSSSNGRSTITFGPGVRDVTDAFTPEMTRKRGGYLQRVRELFRPRSSSLNNLNNEESSSNKEIKSRRSNLKKAKSQTHISQNEISIDIKGTLVKEQTKKGNKGIRNDPCRRCNTEEPVPADPVKSSQECDNEDDRIDDTNAETTFLKVHKPERSYSLIRRESEENDASHVNFTRIPSLRIRKVHLSLVHHFCTTLPPNEADDCHVIKEATNIQPLNNGGAIVTDILSSNIVLFDHHGYPKITFAVESGCEPWATCLTPDGGLAVTLKRQGCVSLWSTSGEPIAEFGHNILSGPAGIQCDKLGRLVVADEQLNSVCIFNIHGEFVAKLHVPDGMKNSQVTAPQPKGKSKSSINTTTQSFNHPRYVCITNSGNYVIADSANHCIKIFDLDMNFKDKFGRYGKGEGHFRFPYGIASDNESYLYVADHFNNRVSLFSPEGKFIEHILTEQDGIARPKSIAVRYPFLYITHGYLRTNNISMFRLRKDQQPSAYIG